LNRSRRASAQSFFPTKSRRRKTIRGGFWWKQQVRSLRDA
jgi:hypothetical protein